VASAPAVFQKMMETTFQGMPHILCYLDDILVTFCIEDEYFKNLDEVLCQLQEHGVRFKRNVVFFNPLLNT